MPYTVVNSAYDISGNGGRKLVRLDNGWLVVGAYNSGKIYFYISIDNGNTWFYKGYVTWTADGGFALASKGSIVYCVTTNSSSTYAKFFKFDTNNTTDMNNLSNGSITLINIDTSQSSFGTDCSLFISQDKTKIGATWHSKNSVYPNSYNVRYCEGDVNADGSITWGSVQQISKANTSGADYINSSVVFINNTPIIIAHYKSSSIVLLFAFVYIEDSFSIKTIYNGGAYAQEYPCVCVSPNGEIHVVWYGADSTNATYNIQHAKSPDGGITWHKQDTTAGHDIITTETSNHQYMPSITCDKNNNFYIYWYGAYTGASYQQIRKISYINNVWSSITSITSATSGNCCFPQLLFDPTLEYAEPLCIYQDNQIGAIQSVGRLSSWQTSNNPVTIINSAYIVSTTGTPVKLSNGWSVVGVIQTGMYGRIRFYVSKDNEATWQLLCITQPIIYNNNNMSITCIGTKVYFLYTEEVDNSPISYDYYCRVGMFDATLVTQGSTLSTSSNIRVESTKQTAIGSGCNIKADTNGVLYVVWCGKNSTYPNSFNIRFAKSVDSGATWTKMDGTAGADQISTWDNTSYIGEIEPKIILKLDGLPAIISHLDYNAQHALFCYSYSGGIWNKTTVEGSTGYVKSSPYVATTENGYIHCFWHGKDSVDTSINNIKWSYSSDNGSTWSTVVKLTVGNMYEKLYPVACTNGNNIHLFFNGKIDSGNIKQVCYTEYNGTSWSAINTLTSYSTSIGNISVMEKVNGIMGWIWTNNQTPSVMFNKIDFAPPTQDAIATLLNISNTLTAYSPTISSYQNIIINVISQSNNINTFNCDILTQQNTSISATNISNIIDSKAPTINTQIYATISSVSCTATVTSINPTVLACQVIWISTVPPPNNQIQLISPFVLATRNININCSYINNTINTVIPTVKGDCNINISCSNNISTAIAPQIEIKTSIDISSCASILNTCTPFLYTQRNINVGCVAITSVAQSKVINIFTTMNVLNLVLPAYITTQVKDVSVLGTGLVEIKSINSNINALIPLIRPIINSTNIISVCNTTINACDNITLINTINMPFSQSSILAVTPSIIPSRNINTNIQAINSNLNVTSVSLSTTRFNTININNINSSTLANVCSILATRNITTLSNVAQATASGLSHNIATTRNVNVSISSSTLGASVIVPTWINGYGVIISTNSASSNSSIKNCVVLPTINISIGVNKINNTVLAFIDNIAGTISILTTTDYASNIVIMFKPTIEAFTYTQLNYKHIIELQMDIANQPIIINIYINNEPIELAMQITETTEPITFHI